MKNEKELIEAARELLPLAELIQDEAQPLAERENPLREVGDLYHEWYRAALTLFNIRNQAGERQKFEQEYEGSFWSAKIIKFLTSGLKVSPLYDPEKPVFDKWTYSFERCFKEPLLKQCNILANLEITSSISQSEGDNVHTWNETICRIFQVFIEKAENAITNNEKKLTYEYLAIFLIGAIDGLTVIGHDERGSSEEIDLWVTNEANETFWQRHVGDPFIVECKNWGKPVGVPEIRSLTAIMSDKNIQFAILLSKNGITGNKYRDAVNLIQKAANKRQYIVIIDHADLLEISNGLSPTEKIKGKFYDLYKT